MPWPGHSPIHHEAITIDESLKPYQNYAQLDVRGDDSASSDEYLVEFSGACEAEDLGVWIAGKVYSDNGHSTLGSNSPKTRSRLAGCSHLGLARIMRCLTRKYGLKGPKTEISSLIQY
ncbi:hypothetical protein GGR52DRAFT_528057 [Hypoxylon sp. FL1284]|nr:hypothetical protein GGR52DRAFT_528057 [Hypoxylon sp. FL1284]